MVGAVSCGDLVVTGANVDEVLAPRVRVPGTAAVEDCLEGRRVRRSRLPPRQPSGTLSPRAIQARSKPGGRCWRCDAGGASRASNACARCACSANASGALPRAGCGGNRSARCACSAWHVPVACRLPATCACAAPRPVLAPCRERGAVAAEARGASAASVPVTPRRERVGLLCEAPAPAVASGGGGGTGDGGALDHTLVVYNPCQKGPVLDP